MITEQRVKELIDEKINFSLEDIGNKISNYTTSEKISSLIKFKSDKLNTSVDRLVGEEPIKNKFIFKNQILKENIKSFNNIRNYYTIVNINNKKYITRFRVVNILEEESSKIIDDIHNNNNYLDNTPISADFNSQGLLNKLPKTAFCFYKYWQNKLTGLQSLAPTGDDFFSSPGAGSGTTPRFNSIISGILTLNQGGEADPDKIYTNILNNNTTSYYTKLLDYQPIEIIDNTIVDNYISINGNINQIANNVILDNLIPLKDKTIDIVLGVSTFSTWSANPNVNNINNPSYTDNIAFYNPLLVNGLNETYGYLPKGFGGGYCIKTAKGFQEINDFSTQSTNVKDSPFVYSSIDGFLLCYGIKDILADYTTNLFLPISISLPPIISCCRYIGDTFDNVNIFNENVGINISNPNYNLDVNGDINFTGTLFQNGSAFVTSRWELSGNDIFRLNTKVGINKSPLYNLDVSGDINFTGTLFQNGSAFVTSRWELSGNDIFRLNTKVGIGKNNPTTSLDVNGTAKATAFNENGTLLSNKYAPISHNHVISDISNLQTELNNKVSTSGNENIGGIKTFTGISASGSSIGNYIDYINFAGTGRRVHMGKEAVGDSFIIFTTGGGTPDPDVHFRLNRTNGGFSSDIIGSLSVSTTISEGGTLLSNKYATISHVHNISDISNLQMELNNKSNVGHTHIIGDITNLQTELNNKSNVGHTHNISDISNLSSSLQSRQQSSYSNIFSFTTNNNYQIDLPITNQANQHINYIIETKFIQQATNGSARGEIISTYRLSEYDASRNMFLIDTKRIGNGRVFGQFIATSTTAGTIRFTINPENGFQQNSVCRFYIDIYSNQNIGTFGTPVETNLGTDTALTENDYDPNYILNLGGNTLFTYRHTVELSSLSNDNFYPVVLVGDTGNELMDTFYFDIQKSGRQPGEALYNNERIHGWANGRTWHDDGNKVYYDINVGRFQDNERSCLGLYTGNQNFAGICFYLRGGTGGNYRITTNSRNILVGTTSAVITVETSPSTFAIKDASGADIIGTSAQIIQELNVLNLSGGRYTRNTTNINGDLNVSGVSSLGVRGEIAYNSGVAGDRLSIGTGTNKMAIRQNGHGMELTTTNNGHISLIPNGTGRLHSSGNITLGNGSTNYNTGWVNGRWIMINHAGFNSNIGGQFPSPEGGILFNSLSSGQFLEHQFYFGLTKDTATSSMTGYRMDFGSTSLANSIATGTTAPTFTPLMTIRQAGIGIGTTSPSERLDVNGNAIVRGDFSTTTSGTVNLTSTTRIGRIGYLNLDNRGSFVSSMLAHLYEYSGNNTLNHFGSTANTYHSPCAIMMGYFDSFQAGTNEPARTGIGFITGNIGDVNVRPQDQMKMYISNTGNVGIGINNPSTRLTISTAPTENLENVSHNIINYQQLIYANTGTLGKKTGIAFLQSPSSEYNATSGQTAGGSIVFERTTSNSGGKLHLGTKTGNLFEVINHRLTINPNNVVIGNENINPTSGSMLYIDGNCETLGNNGFVSEWGSANNINKFVIFNTLSQNMGIGRSFDEMNIFTKTTTTTGHIKFLPNEIERMRITHAGNVGIGTTNPSEKLDVNGTVKATNISALSATIGLNFPTVPASDVLTVKNGNLVVDGSISEQGLLLISKYALKGEKSKWDASGTNIYLDMSYNNVGIGTTAPSRILHLARSNPYIRLHNTDGSGNSSLIGQEASRLAIWTNLNTNADSGWSERFSILNSNGNVGIGTTAPLAPLHILKVHDSGGSINTTNIDMTEADMIVSSMSAHTSRKDTGIMFFANGASSSNVSYASAHITSGWANAGSTNWNKSYIEFKTHAGNDATWTTNMRIQGNVVSTKFVVLNEAISPPSATTRINENGIQFGGNNSSKETNSAQISAGLHQTNSLNIVGMSSGTSSVDRRVDVWAEGGMFIRGKIRSIEGNQGVIEGFDEHHAIYMRENGVNLMTFYEFGDIRFMTNGLKSNQTEKMRIKDNGRVGLGTTNPIATLDIETSSNITFNGAYFAYTSGGQLGVNAGTQTHAYGLRVVGRSMFRSEINVFSDKRIKTNILELSDNECLEKLRLLKPCKYEYIDKVSKGSSKVYGFIAQEVEKVLPYSVDNTRPEIIPDYYNIVNISTIDISFIEFDLSNIEYDLSLNETIRIIIDYSANINDISNSFKDYETKVLNIQGKTIKITNETNSINIHKIFLYGKKVNDFCVLNKSAIWTVATAALQEIDRIQQRHQEEIQDLQTKYDLLLKRLEALENKY